MVWEDERSTKNNSFYYRLTLNIRGKKQEIVTGSPNFMDILSGGGIEKFTVRARNTNIGNSHNFIVSRN